MDSDERHREPNRTGAGRSRVVEAGRLANRGGNRSDLGERRRNALGSGDDQRLDDRIVAHGAAASAGAEQGHRTDSNQANSVAVEPGLTWRRKLLAIRVLGLFVTIAVSGPGV